jgi:small-conductance mechanosensitive channel
MGFGESSINLRAYVWAENPFKSFDLHTDLNRSIKKRFDEEGIEIPFPYRTIVYKKDLEQ